MIKKDSKAPTPPQVSRIPLPISDTPLVVDLPDGQKLVIGKLTSGSIIEVATWRGTGRPDSRTSRMMLGMSSSQAGISEGDAASSAPVSSKKLNKIQGLLLPIVTTLIKVSSSISKKVKQIRVIPDEELKQKQPVTTSEYDSEIKAWIDDIVSKPVTFQPSTPMISPKKAPPKTKSTGSKVKANVKKAKKGRI